MNYVDHFKASYARAVQGARKPFFDAFYRNFILKSEAVQVAFRNSSEMAKRRMLVVSLEKLVEFAYGASLSQGLEDVAYHHYKRGIPDNLFDIYFDALIQTLYEVDKQFDPQDELAWEVMLKPGLEYVKCYQPDIDMKDQATIDRLVLKHNFP